MTEQAWSMRRIGLTVFMVLGAGPNSPATCELKTRRCGFTPFREANVSFGNLINRSRARGIYGREVLLCRQTAALAARVKTLRFEKQCGASRPAHPLDATDERPAECFWVSRWVYRRTRCSVRADLPSAALVRRESALHL